MNFTLELPMNFLGTCWELLGACQALLRNSLGTSREQWWTSYLLLCTYNFSQMFYELVTGLLGNLMSLWRTSYQLLFVFNFLFDTFYQTNTSQKDENKMSNKNTLCNSLFKQCSIDYNIFPCSIVTYFIYSELLMFSLSSSSIVYSFGHLAYFQNFSKEGYAT